MVNPIAEQPSRSASSTEAVMAWSLPAVSESSELEEFSLRMVGIWPAKLSAPASSGPSGAA
jgi:hypothetical protein